MNAGISHLSNGATKLPLEAEQLPEGFFENHPHNNHHHKIFDDDPLHRQKSAENNAHHQETQISRENLKAIISSQLKAYLSTMKTEILSDFHTNLNQKQEESKINTK